MEVAEADIWLRQGRRLLSYRLGGDFPDKQFSTTVAVSVGIGCSLVLILICLAVCCGCMIPSEECFQRLSACPSKTRASCCFSRRCCCCCRHKSKQWIDPHLEPPVHYEKHQPFFEVDEEGPRGWGKMSRECKEALANVMMTMSDCSDAIPSEAAPLTTLHADP